MDNSNHMFLVTLFPEAKDKTALGTLARTLNTALTKATGEAPQIVHPNTGAICLLVFGEFDTINRALRDVCENDVRYLLVRIDTPFSAFGLSSAHAWFQIRTRQIPPK